MKSTGKEENSEQNTHTDGAIDEVVAAWDLETDRIQNASALAPGGVAATLDAIPGARVRVDRMPLSAGDKAQVHAAIDRFEAAVRKKASE